MLTISESENPCWAGRWFMLDVKGLESTLLGNKNNNILNILAV